MFYLGFGIGFVLASVIFIVWGIKNQKKISVAREAILDAYDNVGEKIEKHVKGIDSKLDREIEKRYNKK